MVERGVRIHGLVEREKWEYDPMGLVGGMVADVSAKMV